MGKYHKGIRIEGAEEFLLAVNITGHGAPTEDTEAEPGMCYLDEDSENGDLYKCIGMLVTETGTVYRWKKLAGQEEVDSLSEAIEKKLDADKLPEAVNTALAQAKESGEFDGEDGSDYVLTEEDKTEIAEIAAGMVDVPEGGGEAFKLVQEVTLAEDETANAMAAVLYGGGYTEAIILLDAYGVNSDGSAASGSTNMRCFYGYSHNITNGINARMSPDIGNSFGTATDSRRVYMHIWLDETWGFRGVFMSREYAIGTHTQIMSNKQAISEKKLPTIKFVSTDTKRYFTTNTHMEVWAR